MSQQTYDPTGPDEDALDKYARRLAAPEAWRGGIGYFWAHTLDAMHNREHARTKLTMGGTASFGANLEPEICPLVEHLRSAMTEDCGHYLAEERPERVSDELLRFLHETD